MYVQKLKERMINIKENSKPLPSTLSKKLKLDVYVELPNTELNL